MKRNLTVVAAIVAIQASVLTTVTAQVPAIAADIYQMTLSQAFGRALFRRCDLQIGAGGKISAGRGQATLVCQADVTERDLFVERQLSEQDVEAFGSLLRRSDLYGGGHTGLGNSSSEGPRELLQVACCGRADKIVLVTQGNPTFENGARRELLDVLHRWLRELTDEGQKARTAKK